MDDSVSQADAGVFHWNIRRDADEEPSGELVDWIAELKGTEQDELRPLYTWADHLVSDLYSSPPPADAQAMVKFSYEGYRITLYQDGHAVAMLRSTSN